MYLYIYMFINMYMYMYTRIQRIQCIYICIYTYTYMHAFNSVCVCIYIYIYIYVYVYSYIYIYIYIHMYLYMYIHIYIHVFNSQSWLLKTNFHNNLATKYTTWKKNSRFSSSLINLLMFVTWLKHMTHTCADFWEFSCEPLNLHFFWGGETPRFSCFYSNQPGKSPADSLLKSISKFGMQTENLVVSN